MNLPILLMSPLGAGLLWATVCDLRRRRIPNAVSGLVFVSGLGTSAYLHGTLALGSGLAASFALLAMLFPAWRAGGIGGGDVKLAAAAGAWVGLAHLVWFILATALAGGVVAAAVFLFASPAARAEVKANLVLAGASRSDRRTCLRTAKGTSPFLTPSRFLQARLSRFSSLRCKIGACSAPCERSRS